MFPYCKILFKSTDSAGWQYGKMNGNKEIVNKKCLEQGWFNFIVFDGSSCAWEIADEFPSEIDPYSLHLLSDWIYSNELNRIFLPDEIIPIPTTKAISTENFTIEYKFDAEDNEISELVDIFEDNIKYEQSNIEHTYPTILFIMNNITYMLAAEYSTIFDQRLSNFIEKIERDLFSYLIVDEYNYTKLICWTSNNRCRLKIQNYDDDRVVLEPIDFIIEKNELIKIFKKFKESIFCKHNEFVALINEMRKNSSI